MNDNSLPYWRFELDDGLPRRVKCAGCDRRVLPDDLSPSGHCPVCQARGRDDERELRAEAQRRP